MPSQSLSRVRALITWRTPTVRPQSGVMGRLAAVVGPAWNVCDRALERRSLLMGRVLCVLSLVAFIGCAAAYTPPTLTTQHPAHPEATAAPELPPSTTLAYRPSDIPSPRPAASRAPRGRQGASPSEQKSPQTVVGEGKVIAVEPGSEEVVVKHEEIKGFMGPMTMGYKVSPPSLLNRVNAGDTVRFTIDTEQKAIVKIEKLQP
jgi:Cu(I)/Ag(I) efflux system periplasmic protein CusF